LKLHRSVPALCAVAFLAGCAGAAQNAATLPGTGSGSLVAPQAKLVLDIPSSKTDALGKHAAFVSAGTQSVAVVVNAGSPQVFNTVSNSPNCTSSGTGLVCTFSITVPFGNDAISIATYSAANGGGSVLDQGAVSVAIQAGSSSPISITLDGVPASLSVGSLPSGTAYTAFTTPQSFTVTAKDAGGNIIAGTYTAPITLSDSDTSGATTIATMGSDNPPAGELLSSSDTATLDYGGEAIASATISASAANASGGSAIFVPAPPPSPDVYVADALNKTVVKIAAAGGYTTVTTLGSGFNYPWGLALDANGDIFLADQNASNGTIKEILAPDYTTVSTLISGQDYPEMLALDIAGNFFFTVFYTSELNEAIAPGYTTINPIGSGFSGPAGVALDANENVYVSDSNTNAVYEVLASGGYTTVKTLQTGFNYPIGVAVDASDNVFVVDSNNNAVKEILAAGGYTTVKTLGSGFNDPFGVAVDANDNVYVTDAGNSAVKEILAAGGYTTVKTLGSGFNFPIGIWVNNPAVVPGSAQYHRRRSASVGRSLP
jgi:sugar lactone lactonase YvrE